MNKKYLMIDLSSNSSTFIPTSELKEAIWGCKKLRGKTNVWKSEDYLIVEVLQPAKKKKQ